MINVTQFRENVVATTLHRMGLWSRSAENLLMGTAAQESRLQYLKQIKGPALGVFQIEPTTLGDIVYRWMKGNPEYIEKVKSVCGFDVTEASLDFLKYQCVVHLGFQAAMCRLKYRMVPKPLPAEDDVNGMAQYWKTYYNTYLGKGTIPEFIHNYRSIVKGK